MDDRTTSYLERIARALDSLAASLAPHDPQCFVLYSEDEWDNRDLNELFAEWEDDEEDEEDDDDELEAEDDDWDSGLSHVDSGHDWEREYFDAMTDGMLGSYDDFSGRGGSTDWIDDWAGR